MAARLIEPLTSRLRLRQWSDRDRAPFAALNADPVVMRHFPSTLSREESDALLDSFTERLRADGYGLWAVEIATTGTFVGFVGLSAPRWNAAFTPCTEVGWRLARSAWGQGYATEAADAALATAFGPVGLSEVVSFTTPGNVRSVRVMERLGMRRDPAGDFDHPLLTDGPLRRHVLYRLSRADWERRGQPDQNPPRT